MSAEALLSLENLCVSFFTQACPERSRGAGVVLAVQDVSFSIRKGQTFAILGESGCGKTTVALAIMRLVPARQGKVVQGRILFEGRNLLELSEKQMRLIRGNKISMVFQEPATSLNPVYTVGDQIAEVIELHQNKDALASAPVAEVPPPQGRGLKVREDAVAILRKVGIADPERRALEYPHQFSGGMQQRVMIAMAISCNPALLIADEPTTALDTTVQAQILDLLDNIQEQNGMGILLITHNLGVAAQRADIIAVMYASRIVEIADARQLFAWPLHPYTQALLQSLPHLGSSVERLPTIPGTVPEPLHFPSGCKFHPRCRIGCTDMRCRKIEPALREIQPGRSVACWYAKGHEKKIKN